MSNTEAQSHTEAQIEVGTGVTYCIGLDRYPCTVVEVLTTRKLRVRADDQFSSAVTITLRKNGRWVEQGFDERSGYYILGRREDYQDPSF